jgi:hypothetical protein
LVVWRAGLAAATCSVDKLLLLLLLLLLLQLTTRTFSYGGTEVLLPIVDMANHKVGVYVETPLNPIECSTLFKLTYDLDTRGLDVLT